MRFASYRAPSASPNSSVAVSVSSGYAATPTLTVRRTGATPGKLDLGRRDRGTDLLGDDECLRRGGVRHHHDELLAAVARGEVRTANVADDRPCEGGERQIAGVMTVRVVQLP